MIKLVVAGLWLCVATLGAAFYAAQPHGGSDAAQAAPSSPLMGGLDYVKTEIISVPVVREAAIQGYLLTRLVYTVDPAELRKLSVPAEALLTDEVYTYVYGHPQFDFTREKAIDVDAFRGGVRDSVNARVGESLVHEVMIEQIDFLSKNDIRDNAIRRRSAPAGRGNKLASPNSHF